MPLEDLSGHSQPQIGQLPDRILNNKSAPGCLLIRRSRVITAEEEACAFAPEDPDEVIMERNSYNELRIDGFENTQAGIEALIK